jgi:hypothetical protein
MQITRYSSQIFMQFEFSKQIFAKITNNNFDKNLSIWNPIVPCGRTDIQTHMTTLTVACRNFANALKGVGK